MAAQSPSVMYTCEICGLEGFSDEEMRNHTLAYHVDGQATCPFCDLTDLSSDEMLIHVNQAHLDFLTPEAELMVFIDDQSPTFDEDSDTISECRGFNNTPNSVKNGWHTPTGNGHSSSSNGHASANNTSNGHGPSSNGHGPTSNGHGALTRSHKSINHGDSRSSSQNSLASQTHSEASSRSKKSLAHSSSSSHHHHHGKDHHQSHSSKGHHNGGGSFDSAKTNHKRSESSFSFISKGKSKSKSSSRQSSVESVTSSNHNGNIKTDHKNSGSDYELSPANSKISISSGGQGSPLRSQLALKLKSNTPKKVKPPSPSPAIIQCLMCQYTSESPQRLEEHMNRAHFDLTSPSLTTTTTTTTGSDNHNSSTTTTTANANNPTLALTTAAAAQNNSLCCPLCEKSFTSATELEVHVNVDHRDILSPQKDGATGVDNATYLHTAENILTESSPSPGLLVCPVCCQTLPNCTTQQDMTKHIEEHFEKASESSNIITDQQREVQRHREQREFEMLRAQYGMDEQGNYGQQAARGLRRAVYAGELSVRDYYERRVGLRRAESDGVDDAASRTRGVLARVRALNAQNAAVARTHLCSAVDHYASTYGDRGWGCGFRNMQMLVSALVEHPRYADVVYRGCWRMAGGGGGGGGGGPPASPPRTAVPSISRLQLMVERAWRLGFDTQGAEQLGSKLHNTRKWIGAYEVVAVLSSLRIRCQLVDFHRPTAPDGGHPALFAWVLKYFQENPDEFKPPLYLQHQGHSRTIIGCEVLHKNAVGSAGTAGIRLLVLDPSHGAAQLETGALRALRRAPPALHARQYQLVAVRGLMESDHEYETSKVLRSQKIPDDR